MLPVFTKDFLSDILMYELIAVKWGRFEGIVGIGAMQASVKKAL